MITRCHSTDENIILNIINRAATKYDGVIPEDCYHDPYMNLNELRAEMRQMVFFGYEEAKELLGVAGYQPVKDVTLLRHLYVLPEHQRKGIGETLLNHIKSMSTGRRLLVGTWEAASWAIRFYEKHGFSLQADKTELLRRYWTVPERQIECSVVLASDLPQHN